MRWIPGLVVIGIVTLLLTPRAATGQPTITLEPLITSLPTPPDRHAVGLVNAGDGSGRLFIVVQEGEILVHDGTSLVGTAFLDIRARVLCCGERGLLGLAFHPQYASNGFFFVYYTNAAGGNVLARFKRSATDPNLADPSSETPLFSDTQPAANHNGGQLTFGPDGFLYLTKGDGGSSSNGQNLNTRLGKVLRVQPSLGTTAPFYTVPSTNPFVGVPNTRPEIWAYGLRNPWRLTFDRLTGDMLLADVGNERIEEVNFQAASSPGGENYGWNRLEGSLCFNPMTGCDPTGTVLPVLEYDHDLGCSITGGYRYRGTASPALFGIYLFGDLCSGRIWGGTEQSPGNWTSADLLDTALMITSFGEAESGEVYVVDYAGAIFRIVAASSGGPDLVIETLTRSPATVVAGGQVTVNYRVANRGTTTVTATYTDRMFLSTDQTLGGDVTLGTSHGHTSDLAPGATHVHGQTLTIPANTAPGNYFILVQADTLGAVAETNEGNNVTPVPVTVTAATGADLVIEQLALSSGSVAAGASVTVSYRVANRGTSSVTATYTDRIHLSTDATLGAGNVVLGTSHGHTGGLAVDATHAHSQAVTIPAGTTPGPYFILVQADALSAVGESNEGNNVTAIAVTVTGSAAGPDIVIETLTRSPASVPAGGQVTINYRVANRGTVAVTQTYTDRMYLSTDQTLGGNVVIGTSHGHTTDLAPGATHVHGQTLTIPANTAPGNYFILVQGDALGAVTESSESNNVTAVAITVTAP